MITPYYERDGIIIYCGDCLEIMPQLPPSSIHMAFTDPPYGHNNNNNGDLISRRESALGTGGYVPERDNRAIANDGAEATPLFRDSLLCLKNLLMPGCCCCCCCCGGGPDPQFARWSLIMDEVMEFKQMVVWDKGPMGMGWHYRRSYETVLVGMKPGAACYWFDESKAIENVIRPDDYGIKKIIPTKTQHPTQKPSALGAHFIRLHTQPGMIVIDPFMGSGSTLAAAQNEGRRAIGIELDEAYCKMAVEQLRQPSFFSIPHQENQGDPEQKVLFPQEPQ